MLKHLSLVGAAVAAAVCALPASALPLASANESTTGVVKLIVSGSSAFQSAFETELNLAGSSVCDNTSGSTYNKYTAAVTTGTAPGLAAYSCTSKAGLFATQKPLIIYYRTEGGSVYGLTPVVRPAAAVLRLALNTTNCSGSTCTVGTSYTAATDSLAGQTPAAVNANSDLGLADEEASQFKSPNYPDAATASKLQPVLTAAEITTLNGNTFPLVLQSFGVYVHNETAGPTTAQAALNGLTSLSRQTIADIFRGTWNDWSQVPKNDGSNTTVTGVNSLPIVVCRREAGSGTQVAASLFFHNTNCGAGDQFVTTLNKGNLNVVNETTSTGNMRTCINTNQGAIGYLSAEDNAAKYKLIGIDEQGLTPASIPVATASGDYGFAFELVAVKKSGLTGEPLAVANRLISVAQAQATGPSGAAVRNVTFLPSTNAGNAFFPLNTPAGKQPVSCFARNGNSCNSLADAC